MKIALRSIRKYKHLAALSLVATMGVLMMNNASGPANNSNGSRVNASFSSGYCNSSGCHSGGNFSPSISVQLLSGTTPITTYSANTNYTLRITISASNTNSSTRYGFQVASVQTSSNNGVNNWGTLPSGTRSSTLSGRTHVEQSTPSSGNVFEIPWTSPATSTGSITFYAAGNVVNGNSSVSGDNAVAGTLVVTPPCNTPTISTSVTDVVCKGASTGAITLTATGGTAPITYSWTGPNSYSSNSQNISNLAAGMYTVVVRAGNNSCSTSTSVTVNEPLTGIVATASAASPICEGDVLNLSASSGGTTGSVNYSWTGPNSYSSGMQNNTINNATASMSGTYEVTVTDGSGCSATDDVSVTVNPIASVDTFNFSQGTGVDSQKVTFTSVNVNNADTIKWDFGDGGTDNTANPTHSYTNDGMYTVTLIVINDCGSDTVTRQISVETLDINNITNDNMILVYPNPAKESVTIENKTISRLNNISVVDVMGRVVATQQPRGNKQLVDISRLRAGIYYIIVENEFAQKATRKINVLK